MKTLKWVLFILLGILLIIPDPSHGQEALQKEVESYLDSVRDSFPGVPGIHVVVVDENGILLRASSGLADVGSKEPFTPETGMYIASNTKAFVGLAMAQLIESGKIGLNDPVTDYMDSKYFPDSIDVSNILIRDLIGHTHGLSNDAMTFRTAFAGNAPDSLLPHLLRYTSYYFHPPAKKFRYNNFSYLLCGMVIGQVTGQSWRDYLRDSLLIHAGLEHTTPYYSDYAGKPVVKGYLFDRPGEELHFSKEDNTMHAAGGLVATDGDMARWLRLFINLGRINGEVVLPASLMRRARNILAADTGNMGPFLRYGYGYGWVVGMFNGDPIRLHFGTYTGLGSTMSYLPEQKLGVFTVVNEGVGGLYLSTLVTTWIYNRLLEKENTEEIAAMIRQYVKKAYSKPAHQSLTIAPVNDLPFPSTAALSSDIYGRISLSPAADTLMVRFGNMASPLYKGDSTGYYKVEWVPGDVEWLKIDQTDSGIELQYEEYGVFKEL